MCERYDATVLMDSERKIWAIGIIAVVIFAAVMYPIVVHTHGESRALAMLPFVPAGLLIGHWTRKRVRIVRSANESG